MTTGQAGTSGIARGRAGAAFSRHALPGELAGRARRGDRVVQAMNYILAPRFEDLFTDEGSDTPEDIFRVSFTAVEFNRSGLLLPVRWSLGSSANRGPVFGLRRIGPAARHHASARMAATTRA